MADRPILFSGPMVRALLEGRKTQTRRVFANIEAIEGGEFHIFNGGGGGVYGVPEEGVPEEALDFVRYEIGDRLYVREAWRTAAHLDRFAPKVLPVDTPVFFEADAGGEAVGAIGKFRQAMHMPRWASRLTLPVTDVRVQRLQEISEEDALAEGITQHGRFFGVADADWDHASTVSAVDAYATLWDSLNADRGYGWDTNPWIVAVSFTVERRNIDARAA